jgi:hypothetical protein
MIVGSLMTVAIVLDPGYSGLEQLAEEMPIWAVDTVSHRATAERLWKLRGMADAFQGVTLFKVKDERDAEGNFVNIIAEVDLHHGVYSSGSKVATLRVIGTPPSNRLQEELSTYGFLTLETTSDGFLARTQ